MAIQIEICNSKISDKAKLLKNTNIKGESDTQIKIDNLDMSGDASVLEGLEISEIINDLNNEIRNINSDDPEYKGLQNILCADTSKPEEIKRKIKAHIAEFSKGVLASIVANLITP